MGADGGGVWAWSAMLGVDEYRRVPTRVVPAETDQPGAHDARLREAVQAASDGHSRLVTVVGGSSTGKTRACWEAIQPLAERPEPWGLWHPFDPSRPAAVAAALADVGPYTVVWLNEA